MMRTFVLILLVTLALLKVATGEEVAKDNVEVEPGENKVEEEEVVVEAKTRDAEGEVPIVKTLTGKVSGIKEKSTEGKSFYSYYAIPFAKAPVGSLRFKDPQMISGWGGVRDGSSPPPKCPQISTEGFFTGYGEMEGDEDCLYLNIFTPKAKDAYPLLPVMVYIHGGGYYYGYASQYPPYALLNEDIVLVTIQYRLGILGFMSTEDDVAPGNLGLKDQTLALSWIQRNVALFGGDPLRITLFGESAGASSTHLQILSPKSLGMFQRAILQSGTAMCPWAMGAKFAEVAEFTGSIFNCTSDQGSEELIECLRKVDALKIAEVVMSLREWLNFPILLGPRVDGQFLPAHPDFLMKEGRHKRVDLMTGITQHDGAFVSSGMYADERTRSSLIYDFARKGPYTMEFRPEDVAPLNQTIMIYDHYLGGLHFDAEHEDKITTMFTDRHFKVCNDLTSQLHASSLAPYKNTTYRYELKYRGQYSITDIYDIDIGKHWISHVDDLYYLFEGGMFRPLQTEEDLKMRKMILKLWTNFAATGNPTPDDSLGFKWEPVKNGNLKYLALKPNPEMEEDTNQKTRDFWFSLPSRQNIYLHPELVSNLVYTPVEDTKETKETKDTTDTPPVEAVIDEPPKNKEEL